MLGSLLPFDTNYKFEQQLKTLRYLNPALAYAFDPECSLVAHEIPQDDDTYLVGQRIDYLKALCCAEQYIERIKEKKGIDSGTLLAMIKELHRIIAQTMAADLRSFVSGGKSLENLAGEFTSIDVMRYHGSADYPKWLIAYFSQSWKIARSDFTEEYKDNLMKVSKELKLKFAELDALGEDVLSIHEKLYGHPLKASFLDEFFYNVYLPEFFRELSEDSQLTLKKIVQALPKPAEIPALMSSFVSKTAEQWRQALVSSPSLDAVATLTAGIFLEFTAIHPFFNANGRVATILINIILNTLSYPSILLRHPGERKDPASEYNSVFKNDGHNLSALAELIKKRIRVAQDTGPYKNDLLQDYISSMMRFSALRYEWIKTTCALRMTDKKESESLALNAATGIVDSFCYATIKSLLPCAGIREPNAAFQLMRSCTEDSVILLAKLLETVGAFNLSESLQTHTQKPVGTAPSGPATFFRDTLKTDLLDRVKAMLRVLGTGEGISPKFYPANADRREHQVWLNLPVDTPESFVQSLVLLCKDQPGVKAVKTGKNAKTQCPAVTIQIEPESVDLFLNPKADRAGMQILAP